MADYEMGYMRPPKSGQFKAGQSGNPKGRPSGSKNIYKLLDDIVNEKIQMTKNGKPVRISKKQAMLFQAVNKAVQGDLKAFQTLFVENGKCLILSNKCKCYITSGSTKKADFSLFAC